MKIWIIKGDIDGRLCFDAEDELNNASSLYNFHSKDAVSDWKELKVTFTSGKKTTDSVNDDQLQLNIDEAVVEG